MDDAPAVGVRPYVRRIGPAESEERWRGPWQSEVSALTLTAAILAIAEYAISRYFGWLGSGDIPWLHITVVALAVLYFATRRQQLRTALRHHGPPVRGGSQ